MNVFGSPSFDGHELVIFASEAASGLKAIIALHDRTLGPALGGCRMWPYASEAEALEDVLRLSRSMTYKAAMAGVPFGGGKAVILGDPDRDKSPALFQAFGRAVESLGGGYVTAEDLGVTVADLEMVRSITRHVAGIAEGGAGDPSPATALGVLHGIRTAVRYRLNRDGLDGIRVAVQGLGHVGLQLCRLLQAAGATLTVADIRDDRVRLAVDELGAQPTTVPDILAAPVDVVAPCALGGVINDETVPALQATVVAGSANNQLAEERHGAGLAARGVLYAPDYVINAGGIIQVAHEGPDFDRASCDRAIAGIGETLHHIFEHADAQGMATNRMADYLAEQRLAAARRRAAQRSPRLLSSAASSGGSSPPAGSAPAARSGGASAGSR